jgi:hypothetical protein
VRHRRFHKALAACARAESGPTFDADHFRADIEAIKAQAVIPSNRSRPRKPPLDEHIYKEDIWSNAVSTSSSTLAHRDHATRRRQGMSSPSSPSQP